MTDTSLNIVDLIENNPITKLSNTYKSNLLNKIKTKFTDQEHLRKNNKIDLFFLCLFYLIIYNGFTN